MTLWRWLTTKPEPKGRYAWLTGAATGGFMLISSPLWGEASLWGIAAAGGLSALLGSVLVKIVMERENK